jgi:hypothetical protein
MTDVQDIRAQLRAAAARRNQEREAAIEPLVETRATIVQLEANLAEEIARLQAAHREAMEVVLRHDARNYGRAVRAGWTERELAAVGIGRPARKPPGRKAKDKAEQPPTSVTEEERRAADELTRLTEDMGGYDQPQVPGEECAEHGGKHVLVAS